MPEEITVNSTVSLDNPVVYLSAEFGFDNRLPIYAGGLGVLAGDFMKQAADDNFPVIGVGLLYRGTKMRQGIDQSGWQTESDKEFDPIACDLSPVFSNGQPLYLTIWLENQTVWLRVWKKVFGSSSILYLLDSSIEQNSPELRHITRDLYLGDENYRLKQQLVLGLGAVELLACLKIAPSYYHLNEGRGVFIHLPLLLAVKHQFGWPYDQCLSYIKKQLVYTNHTLEKAGNLDYELDLVSLLIKPYAQALGIDHHLLLDLGRSTNNRYSPTQAALNLSQVVNGVSQVHTRLSTTNFTHDRWVNVTNGVHLPTWQSSSIKLSSDDSSLWRSHLTLKTELKNYVTARTGYSYDETKLVVTWARRVAGYKRLDAIFTDIDRLVKILKNSTQPVQLLIAGKAHQGSESDKQTLKQILYYCQNQLAGHALYIPDYDIELAKHLTSGSDVWLNLPMAGKEACGTSGMKAVANGVLQLTVQDGWTSEVDWTDTGWTLNSDRVTEDLYQSLESQVVPLYYQQVHNTSSHWLQMMKNSIKLADQFSAHRMLRQYQQYLYQP